MGLFFLTNLFFFGFLAFGVRTGDSDSDELLDEDSEEEEEEEEELEDEDYLGRLREAFGLDLECLVLLCLVEEPLVIGLTSAVPKEVALVWSLDMVSSSAFLSFTAWSGFTSDLPCSGAFGRSSGAG